MDCEMLKTQLDAYLDGELSENEKCALVEHAKDCETCRRELRAAEMLRDMLRDMDKEISVPLKAQAAWRGAVRAEAKKNRLRRITRLACAIAAALVLVLGGSMMLKGTPEAAQPLPLLTADGGVIARDGNASATATTGEAQEAYAAWKKIATEDQAAAARTLENLAAEYSGSCVTEAGDVCRIELPCAYLEDFLNAASRIGTELDSETGVVPAETAVVYIQLLKQ